MPLVSLPNNIERTDSLSNNTLIEIDESLLGRSNFIIKAISHKLRRDILQLIHSEGFINVTEIYRRMGLEQTTTSQHLAILRESGFVITQREGKCIFYTVNLERLNEVKALVKQLVNE